MFKRIEEIIKRSLEREDIYLSMRTICGLRDLVLSSGILRDAKKARSVVYNTVLFLKNMIDEEEFAERLLRLGVEPESYVSLLKKMKCGVVERSKKREELYLKFLESRGGKRT